VSRSKRLGLGAAHERPWEPPEGGDDLQKPKLIDALVLLLLSLDVLPDHLFISPDGRYEVSPRPEVLTNEILLSLSERLRDVR
jgi:hypothetical protein